MASNALASSLRSRGVKKGDRVAVSLGNSAEFTVLTYAAFKLGAILVPLNPNFNSQQVTAAINHLGVEILIIGAVTDLAYKPCQGRSNLPLLRELVPDLSSGKIESAGAPTLKTVVVVDNSLTHPHVSFPLASLPSLTPFTTLLPALHPSPSNPSSRPISPDSPLSAAETINIQFTSGTTSHPKATMLSHTNILNNGHLIASRMAIGSSDRIVCPPPLFHCFGSVLGFMATATTGAALIFPAPAFDPLAALRAVADHRGTALYGVPTMFVSMLELASAAAAASAAAPQAESGGGANPAENQSQSQPQPPSRPQPPPPVDPAAVARFPEHLRTGIVAGSSVPGALMRRIHDAFGLPDLVICYGMTETSPVSCMTAPADPPGKRTASVGRAMPHTRVKVVDPADRSRVLPRGERGELAAAGYLVMKGYWEDEERTGEVMIREPDGDAGGEKGGETVWMYSGDEARMDADGYVEITGRIKDLIIRGGENIHPLEIENCLFRHPLIAEVSAVGVPDERYGESVGVFIVVHSGVTAVEDGEDAEGGDGPATATATVAMVAKELLTKAQVRDWVRTRLSTHLVPKHVFWVKEYPKTASGKIQKFKLREMAKEWIHKED